MLGFLAKTMALDIENIRLHRLSVTDTLTGAYNREFLQRHLPVEIERSAKGTHPLSVAMVDIDHFKEVNDELGHDAGDLVLAEVVRRLRAAIRKDDVIIRYGGEEFLVVLPHADAGRAWEVGERMRLKFQSRAVDAETDGHIEIRISVGVAQHKPADDERTAETPADLIRRADTALYSAKGRGRNRVEVAP
jgi:diguanylate cyclase (GGDEF)-like protein